MKNNNNLEEYKTVGFSLLITESFFTGFIVNYIFLHIIGRIQVSYQETIFLLMFICLIIFMISISVLIEKDRKGLKKELIIESSLITNMYQQFDDIDLTVFNRKYFDNEDEVLNFILTQIPEWFINSEAEFLYDSIKEGYLHESNGHYSINETKQTGDLRVFYICNV